MKKQLRALRAIAAGARTTGDVARVVKCAYIQQAQSLVRELKRKGWIEVYKQTSRANLYRITRKGRKELANA